LAKNEIPGACVLSGTGTAVPFSPATIAYGPAGVSIPISQQRQTKTKLVGIVRLNRDGKIYEVKIHGAENLTKRNSSRYDVGGKNRRRFFQKKGGPEAARKQLHATKT
jgi:hypothetical protein